VDLGHKGPAEKVVGNELLHINRKRLTGLSKTGPYVVEGASNKERSQTKGVSRGRNIEKTSSLAGNTRKVVECTQA
jgi:hypothetical protein